LNVMLTMQHHRPNVKIKIIVGRAPALPGL